MTEAQIGLFGIAALLVLLALRVPIFIALTGIPFLGIWHLVSFNAALSSLKIVPYNFAANWQLSSVPMFLLMGYLAFHTGLTKGLFEAAKVWLARLPGGLAIASIFGASGFAALTGSSVACAAAMGRIAIPEMLAQRYNPKMASGCVAAAGTIGALIPPSILFIVYGIIAQVPISGLFLGGLVAGVLTAVSYIAVVVIWAMVDPNAAPRVTQVYTWSDRIRVLKKVGPALTLVILVFGGLYSGAFTPTEAGAVGALLVGVISVRERSLTWANFKISVIESFNTTAAIFVIAIGANLLARFVTISGADTYIFDMIKVFNSNTTLLLWGIVVLYLILGCFLDPLGALLLTAPIVLPIVSSAGLDLMWFGIILAKLLEIGMITPPIGLNVFVIKNVVGDKIPLYGIFRGVMYFLLADIVVVAILINFEDAVLYLPRLLG